MDSTAKKYQTLQDKFADCQPVQDNILDALTKILGGQWASPIIAALADGPYYFNELRGEIDRAYSSHISSKTLSLNLKNLAKYGVVKRRVISAKPLRVSYELTDAGKDLIAVLAQAKAWEDKWKNK